MCLLKCEKKALCQDTEKQGIFRIFNDFFNWHGVCIAIPSETNDSQCDWAEFDHDDILSVVSRRRTDIFGCHIPTFKVHRGYAGKYVDAGDLHRADILHHVAVESYMPGEVFFQEVVSRKGDAQLLAVVAYGDVKTPCHHIGNGLVKVQTQDFVLIAVSSEQRGKSRHQIVTMHVHGAVGDRKKTVGLFGSLAASCSTKVSIRVTVSCRCFLIFMIGSTG